MAQAIPSAPPTFCLWRKIIRRTPSAPAALPTTAPAPTNAPIATTVPAIAPTNVPAPGNKPTTAPPTSAPANAAPASSSSAQADFDVFWNRTRFAGPANSQYRGVGAPIQTLWGDYANALSVVLRDYGIVKNDPSILDVQRNPSQYQSNRQLLMAHYNQLISASSGLRILVPVSGSVPDSMRPLFEMLKGTGTDGFSLAERLPSAYTSPVAFASASAAIESDIQRIRADNASVAAFVKPYCDKCVSSTP